MTGMMMRLLLLTLWWLLLVAAACAQPQPDDTWLTMRILRDDGTPFPSALATIARQDGSRRLEPGRKIYVNENLISYIGVAPGTYSLLLSIPSYGISDGPRTLQLLPGPNLYEWRLPPMVPLEAELRLGEDTAVNLTKCQAYLLRNNANPVLLNGTLRRGVYQMTPLFAGEYRMLFLTEAGYALTTVTVTPEQRKTLRRPMSLLPAGVAEIRVTDEEQHEMPNASVTLRCEVEKGYPIIVSSKTDKIGKIDLLPLPPGAWRWTVTLAEYQSTGGTLTITAGTANPLTIALAKKK